MKAAASYTVALDPQCLHDGTPRRHWPVSAQFRDRAPPSYLLNHLAACLGLRLRCAALATAWAETMQDAIAAGATTPSQTIGWIATGSGEGACGGRAHAHGGQQKPIVSCVLRLGLELRTPATSCVHFLRALHGARTLRFRFQLPGLDCLYCLRKACSQPLPCPASLPGLYTLVTRQQFYK